MNDEPGPTTWFGRQREQIKKDAVEFNVKDCAGCRYIGGTFLISVGGYLGYAGHRRALLRGGSTMSRLPSAIVAGLMVSLGIMRLMGQNPFTSSDSEVGIDFMRRLFPKRESDDSSTPT